MRANTKIMALAASAALLAGAARAEAPAPARADVLQKLSACRGLAEDAARLACFDAATAAMDAAEKKGDLVVMDRGQIREAKRQAFGLELGGAFRIFDRASADGGKSEEIDEVTLTVARASRDREGHWVLTATDGQVWRQIDGERVNEAPKQGSKMEIRKASLGSFFLKVDGQRAIRARREQ
ncbi:hypothetical protein [Caulobacter sp. 17J65-9]|uniref:hypothetical protein n=1 Tax=Caulobacter sp. 17J65-9 TaxID=2709382 RepID=UPI0013CC6579|nr:hypothetical protein [Caulobacter sp. 17J65-9]NEX91477.1 hypothetical protein [Caulobacter sp. 17J65-9]